MRRYNETIETIYTYNKFFITTPTALRKFSRLSTQNMGSIRDLEFTFSHPHVPCFTSLPYIMPSPTAENQQYTLQPQDITWIESWEIFKGMRGLKKLRVELDVPALWRNVWRSGEGEMLRWIEGAGLDIEELVIGVPWDVGGEGFEMHLGVERRERFGKVEDGVLGGERSRWRVERLQRKEEEMDLWQRDWGYLVDLGMSA
jgi:hypothetical protein